MLDMLFDRNPVLATFGAAAFACALAFGVLSFLTDIQVMGVNAWYKPIKFSLSIGIYAWTMAWLTHYLPRGWDLKAFDWLVVILLGFEILYIGWQAGRGELSHFNQSTPFHSTMFGLMALAATAVSLGTAYVGWRFFTLDFPELPLHYVWAIRLGLLLFVIFSLQGFAMGARLAHTVGGPDGEIGLPFLNWSTRYGDLRTAHFIGMHALQALPLLSFYVLKNLRATLVFAFLYACLAIVTWILALQGKPLINL